mgnify:CR=1 FL=1
MARDREAIIRFGDGTTAWLEGIPREFYKDSSGHEMITVRFKPGEAIMKKYNLTSKDYNYKGKAIERQYQKKHFARLSDDSGRRRIEILCGPNNEATAMTDLFKEKDSQINYLESELHMCQLEIMKLKEELSDMKDDELKATKKQVEVWKLRQKVVGKSIVTEGAPQEEADVAEYG